MTQPTVRAIAEMLGRLPVSLKGAALHRIGCRFCGMDRDTLIGSNLGISSNLRFEVPLSRPDLVFSRPDQNLAERATLDLASLLANRCSHFIDVGANYGIYSALLSARCGIAVTAIEADPRLHDLLARNVAASLPNVEVIHAAAAARDAARIVFNQNLDDDLSGSLTATFTERHATRTVEVPGLSLATLISQKGLTDVLVKVDVEGAGVEVWEGLALAAGQVEFLIMEILTPEVQSELPTRICNDAGFNSYYICDYNIIQTSLRNFNYVEPFYNWLFTRHSLEVLREFFEPRFQVTSC